MNKPSSKLNAPEDRLATATSVLTEASATQAESHSFSSGNVATVCNNGGGTTEGPVVQQVSYNVDLRQYSQEALNAVLYTYSGKFFVEQNLSSEGTNVEVKLLVKDLNQTLTAEEQRNLRGEFQQNLIDQQVRLDLEQRFGHIRDLLVAEAFKPVN